MMFKTNAQGVCAIQASFHEPLCRNQRLRKELILRSKTRAFLGIVARHISFDVHLRGKEGQQLCERFHCFA